MPVDVGVIPGFVAVILLFLVPPGPDMAYVVAVGLGNGRRAAGTAILGIGTGMAGYAGAVVLGVGALARSHPVLLDIVKVCGAAYLAWLAYSTVRSARRSARESDEVPALSGRPYRKGVLVSLTNPKVILFFAAVLPQFTGEARNETAQLAMLGAVNVLTEVVLYGAIGMVAGTFHARFSEGPRAGVVLNYLAGAVYAVLAGVVLADVVRG